MVGVCPGKHPIPLLPQLVDPMPKSLPEVVEGGGIGYVNSGKGFIPDGG